MEQTDIYAIGDVQGCLESLEGLLEQIPENARIVFVGDIINRGPQSLASLRLVKHLVETGRAVNTVLGNHDLHLLAVAAGAGKMHRKDTIAEILQAPDAQELIDWIRTRPLLIELDDTVFVHAGIPPQWSMKDARRYAAEVQTALQSDRWKDYLAGMYGDDTDPDSESQTQRMRAILNGFTRMRYFDSKGKMDFEPKMGPKDAPKGLIPWFDCKRKVKRTICFGHWSTLGLLMRDNIIAIDTGCLWGGSLTAVRIRDRRIFTEQCPQWAAPAC